MSSLFSANELDHLFAALILHAKTTRKEQAAWVAARAKIWDKIIAQSDPMTTPLTILRTAIFHSPGLLNEFWQSP